MAVTLRSTFKPFLHLLGDIPRTFTPYGEKSHAYRWRAYLRLNKFAENDQQALLNDGVWGDISQPIRGVVNMGKGLLRLLRGVCKLVPVVFVAVCLYEFFTNHHYKQKPLLVLKGEMKKLAYDLVNGFGILLRGALQLVTTPLTWLIRIPLRLALKTGVYNQGSYEKYNAKEVKGGRPGYAYDQLTHPLQKTAQDFKGTLAAYDRDRGSAYLLIINVLSDFAQPVYGVLNILAGAISLPFNLLRTVFVVPEVFVRCLILGHKVDNVLFDEGDLSERRMPGSLFATSVSIEFLFRGILQLATTPLQWFIRMPLRALITYHVSKNEAGRYSIKNERDSEEDVREVDASQEESDSEEAENDPHAQSYKNQVIKRDSYSGSDNENSQEGHNSAAKKEKVDEETIEELVL